MARNKDCTRRIWGPWTLPSLGVLGLVIGCQSAGPPLFNLRQTRNPDGTTRRSGLQTTQLEWHIQNLLGGSGMRFSFINESAGRTDEVPDGQSLQQFQDPLGLGFESLRKLLKIDPSDPWAAGVQVETCAWLAVDDVYRLSREYAVSALGAAGERLGLGPAPWPLPAEDRVASPAALARAVNWIVDYSRNPSLIERYRAQPPAEASTDVQDARRTLAEKIAALPPPPLGVPVDLIGALNHLDSLTLDRNGARRALSSTCALIGFIRFEEQEAERYALLHREMQARCVELALTEALSDPDDFVRAAALEAVYRASGQRAPAVLQQALADPSPLVRHRALQVIAVFGLPEGLAPEDYDREGWIAQLVHHSGELNLYVATAACKALSAKAGADFQSLQPERWEAWQRARSVAGVSPPAADPDSPAGDGSEAGEDGGGS